MRMLGSVRVASLSLLAASVSGGQAPPQIASLGTCPLQNGARITGCRISYRTYGKLNTTRSNAVLRTVGFQIRTTAPPATAAPTNHLNNVDTTRFFLIHVDALGNGASSSPSNSEEQPGDRFPAFTIRDMVNSQYRLVSEHLRLQHLHAVIGGSMGGMQAFEWAVAYPDFVDRVVAIIPSPKLGAYDRLLWTSMLTAIEDGKRLQAPPLAVMHQAMRISMLAESTPDQINTIRPDSVDTVARTQAEDALRVQTLEDVAGQLRAMLAHDVSAAFGGDMSRAARAVRSRLLVVFSPDDHMVTPGAASAFARSVGADTLSVRSLCGHNVFTCERNVIAPVVRRFLER